jgi:hypothetical protein
LIAWKEWPADAGHLLFGCNPSSAGPFASSASYAHHLKQQFKEIDEYIAQQQKRVDAWTLKEMEPLAYA